MALFGKNSDDSGSDGDGFTRDLRKARSFFEHAQTVADARNYDYAIECYINGLRHDPENLDKHEALREVALKRKVGGGKPAGFGERFKGGGTDAVDKMLHAEKLWSKDPLKLKLIMGVMKSAVEADSEQQDTNLSEVAYWLGGLLLDSIAQNKRQDKGLYIVARDLFVRIEAFDKAVEACRRALTLDPDNSKLVFELKNLEAERTMQVGGYLGATAEEGGSRRFIRDAAKQRNLEQEDALRKSQSDMDEIIERRREAYEQEPQDSERLLKLVEALVRSETEAPEGEAIELLNQAWEDSGQYRYKVRIGDIRMKQMNRIIRPLRAGLKQNPNDAETKQKWEEARRKQLAFELREYTDRVKNYPTDMAMRFELGRRLYLAGKIDDAIGAFQQARADPKHRSSSYEYLGRCYVQKDWLDMAIDTLHEGIEKHQLGGDKLGLELRYLLMGALEKSASKNQNREQAREALKIGSGILQTDINYRDIRDRIEQLRDLVARLDKSGSD